MRTEFDDIASAGVIYDQPPWKLGNAWSDTRNMRFRDGAIESFDGQTQVFGTPLGGAYRLHPISNGTEYFWVYAGINQVWATNGTVHREILATGTHSATEALGWNGGAFQDWMVLNEGNAEPVTWQNDSIETPMQALVNWPADLRAQVIRPFRNYLFALGCTESGILNPRLLRHSNGATIGSLPSSWDYTDPNEDTGRVEFGQTTDNLVDAVPLRDVLCIYKQNHTWLAQYVGGVLNPFQYRQVFSQVGALSRYCAVPFLRRHCVLSSDDVVVHDLNEVQSIIDKRNRRWLFNQINPSYYFNSYVAVNYRDREIWICIPEVGAQYPNLALVWNWSENTFQVRELGIECPHINWGVITTQSTTIDGLPGTIDELTGPIDKQLFNPSVTDLLMANPAGTKLLQVTGATLDGDVMNQSVIREAIPLGDLLREKRVHRIFPKVIGNAGETINIYIGTRQRFEDSVSWSSPQVFTLGTDIFSSFRDTGRIIDLWFEYQGSQTVRLFGYDIEWEPAGLY